MRDFPGGIGGRLNENEERGKGLWRKLASFHLKLIGGVVVFVRLLGEKVAPESLSSSVHHQTSI